MCPSVGGMALKSYYQVSRCVHPLHVCLHSGEQQPGDKLRHCNSWCNITVHVRLLCMHAPILKRRGSMLYQEALRLYFCTCFLLPWWVVSFLTTCLAVCGLHFIQCCACWKCLSHKWVFVLKRLRQHQVAQWCLMTLVWILSGSCDGVQQTVMKVHSAEKPELPLVFSLKPGVCQNI